MQVIEVLPKMIQRQDHQHEELERNLCRLYVACENIFLMEKYN